MTHIYASVILPSLVQIMACRLVGAKPLPEPMLVCILLIGPLGTNFSGMLIEIHTFSFKKIHLKMSSGKWRPFCLGLNVSNQHNSRKGWHYGRETHICVSIYVSVVNWEGGGGVDSDNGLSVRCQVIIWTNAGLILTGPLGTYLSDQSNFHSSKSIENVVCKTEAILSRSQSMCWW